MNYKALIFASFFCLTLSSMCQSSPQRTYHTYEIELKVHLANSYLYQGRIEESQALFRELARKRKHNLSIQERQQIVLLSINLEQHYNTILQKADTFYSSKEYLQASLLYECIKIASEKHYFPCTLSKQSRREFLSYINYRLGCCYFLAQDYKKAINTLRVSNKEIQYSSASSKKLFWRKVYLQAIAYKKLGLYEQARKAFLTCTHPQLRSKALLEAAFCSLQLQKWKETNNYLSLFSEKATSKDLLNRSIVIKILMEIEQQNFTSATLLLETLNQIAIKGSPLHFECAYLEGYLNFRLGNLENAVIYFEKSVQPPNLFDCEWVDDAFYFLGSIYLEMAQNNFFSSESQYQAYFERACDCFHLAIQKSASHKKERAYLGLSYTLLAQSSHASPSKEKLEQLLDEASFYCSQEACYEISFCIAQCSKTYEPLLQERYTQYSLYPQVLFAHGKKTVDLNEALEIFDQVSAITLQHEASSSKPKELELYRWVHCLALQEKLYTREAQESSSLIFELYKFLSCYPQSIHTPEAISMLGRLFWKNKEYLICLEMFETLLTKYPNHYRKDETLFFRAMSLEKLYGISEETSGLFFELFSLFPSSPYAAESYFRSYNEHSYLTGNEKALLHLKNMPTSMNDSPFAAIGAFYIGCHLRGQCPDKPTSTAHLKQLEKAIYFFELASTRSQKFSFLRSLFLHSQFKKAEALFTKAHSKKCEDTHLQCEEIITALKIDIKESDQKLMAESSWLKAQSLLLRDKKSEAREELCQLIEYCQKRKQAAHEPFIKALCALSSNKVQEGLFEEASNLLTEAEEFQAKGFRRELLLEIWIAKSELYCKQQQFGKAMAILSQVINDDCASSLRIQAMYLRAEMYERQGRKDLAIRQLEAVVKKGGEWASLASSRLEECRL